MAVQDNPNYTKWEKAKDELDKRKRYYEAAKDLSKNHPLRKICKRNLERAKAAYDKIVGGLE